MDLTKNEKLVLNSKTCHPSGLHYMRRNPHPKKEDHGDCGVRAITLVTGLDYLRVKFYADRWLQETDYSEPCWGYRTRYKTAYGGMTRGDMTSILHDIGRSHNTALRRWSCRRYETVFHKDNLPSICIVEQAQHFVAVNHGAIWDSWDCRGKTKKLKKVECIWCPDNAWHEFMDKHNGDLRASGVVQ